MLLVLSLCLRCFISLQCILSVNGPASPHLWGLAEQHSLSDWSLLCLLLLLTSVWHQHSSACSRSWDDLSAAHTKRHKDTSTVFFNLICFFLYDDRDAPLTSSSLNSRHRPGPINRFFRLVIFCNSRSGTIWIKLNTCYTVISVHQ